MLAQQQVGATGRFNRPASRLLHLFFMVLMVHRIGSIFLMGGAVEARDFRVEIGGVGGAQGYEVVLRAPDGGETAETMRLPMTASELEALAARIPNAVVASSATVRHIVSDDERPANSEVCCSTQRLQRAVEACSHPAAIRPLVRAGSFG